MGITLLSLYYLCTCMLEKNLSNSLVIEASAEFDVLKRQALSCICGPVVKLSLARMASLLKAYFLVNFRRYYFYQHLKEYLSVCILRRTIGFLGLEQMERGTEMKAEVETTPSSSSEAKKKEALGWMEWIRGWFYIIYETLFQRILASHLENPLPLTPVNDLTCIVTGSTSGIGCEIAR